MLIVRFRVRYGSAATQIKINLKEATYDQRYNILNTAEYKRIMEYNSTISRFIAFMIGSFLISGIILVLL